mmetsp:Transcript_14691/g.62070  ORF Transcript_14691/g.62070 Transcript_14691/m.62070 type:complete len:361 (-) Transcript_14691:635-1717(-)
MRAARFRRRGGRADLPDGPGRRALGGARGARGGRARGRRRRVPQLGARARTGRRRGRRGRRPRPFAGIARRRRDPPPGRGRQGPSRRGAPQRGRPRGRTRGVHLPVHVRRGRTRRLRRRRGHRAVPRRQPPSPASRRDGQAVQRLQVRHDRRREDRHDLGAQRVGHGSRREAAGVGGAREVGRRGRRRHHRAARQPEPHDPQGRRAQAGEDCPLANDGPARDGGRELRPGDRGLRGGRRRGCDGRRGSQAKAQDQSLENRRGGNHRDDRHGVAAGVPGGAPRAWGGGGGVRRAHAGRRGGLLRQAGVPAAVLGVRRGPRGARADGRGLPPRDGLRGSEDRRIVGGTRAEPGGGDGFGAHD